MEKHCNDCIHHRNKRLSKNHVLAKSFNDWCSRFGMTVSDECIRYCIAANLKVTAAKKDNGK